MKVNLFKQEGLKENHIDLYYDNMDEETRIASDYLNHIRKTIIGKKRDEELERFIYPAEIFYLEIVDRKCFLYLANSEWQSMEYRLNTFLEQYADQGFVRVSKSQVVNIYHIKKLKAEYNMRVLLILDNDEKIVLNRGYRDNFYQYLNRMRERKSND